LVLFARLEVMAALATIISPDWCVISAAIEKAQRSRVLKNLPFCGLFS
jgi:hypothetical protein